jgi:hypothetical protein
MFENRVLNYFGPRGRQYDGEKCIKKRFVICALPQVSLRLIKSRTISWTGHVAFMGKMRTLKGGDHL